MTLQRTTAVAALDYARRWLGWSRKTIGCPWSNTPTIDDCAMFMSHVLWGGDPGPIAWVDDFKHASDGTYHSGKSGMEPGDIVLFDWEGNGIGNHVEMCVTAPTITGAFQTIGANGSDSINVGYRWRNAYVLGYFRPSWGKPYTPPKHAATTVTTDKDDDMATATVVSTEKGQGVIVSGKAARFKNPQERDKFLGENKGKYDELYLPDAVFARLLAD